MLTIPENVRIYLAAGATDMRKSFDTLAAVTRTVIGQDPQSGHLFVFCNGRRDRLKILHWESSGYWLLAKRLEKGTFSWPDAKQASVTLTATELAVLLGGLDVRDTRKRPWYGR